MFSLNFKCRHKIRPLFVDALAVFVFGLDCRPYVKNRN